METNLYETLYAAAKEGWKEAGYWKGRYQASKFFGYVGAGILGYELVNKYLEWKDSKEDENFD